VADGDRIAGGARSRERHEVQNTNMTKTENVLIGGEWRPADATATFQAIDPSTGETIGPVYPVSSRRDVDAALAAGSAAANELLDVSAEKTGDFLDRYADRIDGRSREIAETANLETALPLSPRLADVELPRTSNQLRQAAAAARERSWSEPTIDTKLNIRSMLGALGGPVAVFGPNNFPLAFNGAAGGDFAAAIAAGNPVIAKAHPSHPRTSQLLMEEAFAAVQEVGLPAATVQTIYRTNHKDGTYLVSHPLIGATGYTGSRRAGLTLKAAADAAGKPIYLEMSSINPVFILRGALKERGGQIAEEFQTSALMGTGQFCTNPGIVVLEEGEEAEQFIAEMQGRFDKANPTPLLGFGGLKSLGESVEALQSAGATLVTGGSRAEGNGCRYQNTLLRTTGEAFIRDSERLQTEAFGNSNLFVVVKDAEELEKVASSFEGNLTGSIYTGTKGEDDGLYARVERHVRRRVGRLLNDKMPTGVAVTPAMNHGGPYPATGHPGFTSVGIPASIRRFAALHCFDNVREPRLPAELGDRNPGGLWRRIDGAWTRDDVKVS
jgi:NADP-dependent aldehyde dehydrogenase